ncbi:NUDIX hydrolase [Mangrovibrevibacter kandeliae]|uniref:NUDIX hydrolase n=1 Tax=Mangrovibrevibacter kandeliae TaxID=2968473 RepID=UPI0021176BCB|nr:NUDIX domain-containing protein [Aurantimonas sp. CSK15Z-1]MCQ8781156.1 NUDIX domain-containing protein [Aurantimonas sp. CSK15Z-1]
MTVPCPTLGVSICIFQGDDVLLAERGKPPFEGCFSLPGGRVEFGETLEAAARRELREETGVVPQALAFLQLHEIVDAKAGTHVVIAVHVGELPAGSAPSAGDDARSLRLASPEALAELEAAGRLTPGLVPIVVAARGKLRHSATTVAADHQSVAGKAQYA